MSGIPVVVVPKGGIPVRSVDGGAPVMTIADNGMGIPITYSNNGAPFVVRGGGSAWTPSSLFKNGEQGWLMGLSLESLFQDAAGTIPVTEPGQPVGRVVDQSGRGNHWTQPTALNRPIYQVDAEGNPYLSFNGTNQWMQTAAFDWGSDEVTQVVGLKRLGTGLGIAFEFSAAIAQNPGSFYLASPENTTRSLGTAARGLATLSAALLSVYPGLTPPDVSVATAKHTISGNRSDVWRNGVAGTPATGAKGGGNFGNYPLFIGMRGGSSTPFNGNIYPSLGINRLLSGSELPNAEAWVAKRTGGLTA